MTDAELIWKFILALSVLAGLAVAVKKVFFSRTPQPFETRAAEEFVSHRECGILHHNMEVRLSNLEHRFDKHISEVKTTTDALREDITKLSDRMDDKFAIVSDTLREISRAVGRLEGS